VSHDNLYREDLLRLARDPCFRGPLAGASRRATAINELCGDELCVELALTEGGRVAELRCTVRGCAIAAASARLLAELARGADRGELSRWREQFAAMLAGAELPAGLELLRPLLALRGRHSRHGCALLPWRALDLAFDGEP
jgi:nitrogen fixation NifU-like protein